MMKTIEISEIVHDKLSKLVKGFGETPNSVIERLLNEAEGNNFKPSLIFYPEDETRFKKLLMRDKKAEVILYKDNGELEILRWNAVRFKESSNIKANIWSGYLRNWEAKGIKRAEFSIYEKPIDSFRDHEHFKLCETLSPLLNVPYKILIELEFEQSIENCDGEDLLMIQFHDGQNLTLLENNEYFDSLTNSIRIPQHNLNYPL
tara:strand:+ start:2110 stop:2721 length:612 start_codon:yes stop_codon:yes gene_type:complete